MPKQQIPAIIAVMGVTGVGKSYFISKAIGKDVGVGNSLESCTSKVTGWNTRIQGQEVILLDTPGFDDSYKNDAEILEMIAQELCIVHTGRGKLSGIIYLHQITDARMRGTALKNLQMFQKLIGNRNLESCLLVTTKWTDVNPRDAEIREKDLYDKFWAPMIHYGARTERFDGSEDYAITILSKLVHRSGMLPHLTEELCVQKKKLKNTDAGRKVEADMNEKVNEMREQIEIAKQEAAEAKKRNDKAMEDFMNQQKAEVEEKMKKMEDSKVLLETQLRETAEQHKAAQEEWQRNRRLETKMRKNGEHSGLRAVGRTVLGLLGMAAIVGTGGLALPLVAPLAVLSEAVMQDIKETDQQELAAI